MSEPDAREVFAANLRHLHRVSGVSYNQLVGSGKALDPPVELRRATLSDWMRGESVPSDPELLKFVIEHLNKHAKRRGVQIYPSESWENGASAP